jgi:hypothetical protein
MIKLIETSKVKYPCWDFHEYQQFGGIIMVRVKNHFPLTVLILILFVGLFASACSSGGDGSSEGESLLASRCTECHTLSRVENAEKTRDEWTRTIDRMVAMGAELNSEERVILLDYLEANYSK